VLVSVPKNSKAQSLSFITTSTTVLNIIENLGNLSLGELQVL
jgi:hypothetical protein